MGPVRPPPDLLERHAVANRENFWNGRPISLIVPSEPLRVLDGQAVPLIELIPPVHQRVYKMAMEHLGVVVGDEVDEFSRRHRAALTGQQFQSAANEPYVRRLLPRRRLGPAAAGHGDRPEPLPR